MHPIVSSLRRHRMTAAVIVLEIALTCAIVCNTIFLIADRLSRMDQPTGVAETELVRVRVEGIGSDLAGAQTGSGADTGRGAAVTVQDLAALRAIPGVRQAVVINSVPFGNSAWSNTTSAVPDDPSAIDAGMFTGSEGVLDTLGLRLVAGRDFTPGEYVDYQAANTNQAKVAAVLITRAVADRLFPGKSPLGQPLYAWSDEPSTIVGVIDHITRAGQPAPGTAAYAIVVPVRMPYSHGGTYVLRVDPARRAEVLAAVDDALFKVEPSRVITERGTFTEMRADYFKQDRAMAYLLVGVSLALLLVTALGVVGLASFWVQQRTRQIGIRRALGATRGDIVRYFQAENFLIVTLGIAAGMVLAYGINLELIHKYHVARLPAAVLPVGAVLLWLLGQLAVLGPALHAASVPPAIATRSV